MFANVLQVTGCILRALNPRKFNTLVRSLFWTFMATLQF